MELQSYTKRLSLSLSLSLSHLDIPLPDGLGDVDASCTGVQPSEGHGCLPNDVIAGKPVKAEHQEMERELGQGAVGYSIEGKRLIKHRIQGPPQHTCL